MNKGFSKRGSGLVIFSALNAVATTSIYKYHITNFNSPEIEQLIILSVLLVFFIGMSFKRDRSNPFLLFKNKLCLAQAGLMSAGATLDAFSLLFGIPSVLVAVKRVTAVFTSVITGRTVFEEKHLILKLTSFVLCATGIILLVM